MKKLELPQNIKRKEIIELFKLSVNNQKHNLNTPDEIFFCGYNDYKQNNAFPFVYLRFRDENKLFYGEPGSMHLCVRPNVQRYLVSRGYKPSDITGYKSDDEYIDQPYYQLGKYLDFADEEFAIKGRYFIIDVPYINQKCVVFGFWFMNKYPVELTNEIVYQVCKDKHLFDRRIFIINGTKPLIEYNSFTPGEDEIEDNTPQGILHMMSPEEKQKATSDFRKNRDKLIGQKLTMSNGKEMPMAQYNTLKYVDENVINESVDKNLEEEVRKAVRDMIKDGELPKYYGNDKAPLEMAEHYGHILKKVFGDDYKIYHTQSMEDDDICCAVIDDEFKKNGGHYDMDDCENHLESVKKWLDKILKEEYSMMSTKKIYLTESQLKYIKENKDKLLNESSRDNQLLPYLEILNKRGNNVSLSEFKNYLMKKFVTEANIHALSLGSNFYLVGVARYYLNGDLTSNKRLNIYYPQVTDKFIPEICQRLDEIIVYLRNTYIDTKGKQFEQPEDFGTLSIAQLFKKYGGKVDKLKNRGIKQVDTKPKFEMSPNIGKDYTFDVMYSHEDCRKYNQATSPGAWCITYAENHYNYYTRHNSSHFVIFRRNGYENIPRQVGPNFPLDEYGLSLLAVQQSNGDGRFICCTTRWNHGGYGGAPSIPNADNALDYEQLKKITGISDEQFSDIFKVWKENKPKKSSIDRAELNAKKLEVTRKFKYIEMLFRNGMTLQEMYNNKLIHGGKVLYPAGKTFSEVKPGRSVFMLRISETIADNDGVESINSYETIMDRGEVKVDEVLIQNGEIYTPKHTNSWSSFSREDIPENSCAICEINDKKAMFYNYRTHSIVEIGGVKYFRGITELTEGASYILLGCGSNQEMIYDFSTGRAVTIDGKSVFEEVIPQGGYSSQRLRCIVECVYDSAAKDIYFYDVLENKTLNKLTELARTSRCVGISESAGNYLIVTVDNYNGGSSFERKNVLYNPDTDKLLYIDDTPYFEGVKKLTDEWVNINDRIINVRTFEALKYPNGEDVLCKYASHFTNTGNYSYLVLHGGNYNLLEIFLGKGENGKDKYVFYDLNTNSFYKNENGGFVFDYYGHCKVYTKNGNIVILPDRANGEYWYQNEKFDNASVQKLLDEGMKPEEIFDAMDRTSVQGISHVRLNNLSNFLNTSENKLLSQNEWFSEAGDFHCGYASVKRIGEHGSYMHDENYISADGTFLLDDNVGEAMPFNDYKKTAVVSTYRYWVINTNGEKIHPGFFNKIEHESTTDRYPFYRVLETRQQRKWRYLSLKGRVYNNYLDAIEDSESDRPSALEMERERQQNHNAEVYGLNESKNFDAAARTHYSITGEKLGHYCHVVDNVINEMENNFNTPIRTLTRESLDELCSADEINDVMQSFNVQQHLNEKIWDEDNHLNPRIRLKLLEIADKFYKTMETNWVKPVDVIFTGSLCNYNWSKYSDIDLHVVVDFNEVDDRTNFVKDYFDAKKKMWNEAHEDLKIYGFPVELYVQDENEEHTASGIYSLYKDNWIVEPSTDTFSGENIDKNLIAYKVMSCAEKIDNLEKQYNEENDSHKIEIIANKVKSLFDKIKGVRKESLKKEGEMSNGNIWFKSLRRLGYIEKLIGLKTKTFDKINSIP